MCFRFSRFPASIWMNARCRRPADTLSRRSVDNSREPQEPHHGTPPSVLALRFPQTQRPFPEAPFSRSVPDRASRPGTTRASLDVGVPTPPVPCMDGRGSLS